jgi:hypothetical protein
LRALYMRYGHSARRAPRIRANASETRLMGNIETGSRIHHIILASPRRGMATWIAA